MPLSSMRPVCGLLPLLVAIPFFAGGCSAEERVVDPAAEIGTTERQREWNRTLSKPLGFLEAPFLKAVHLFEDLSDGVTEAPKRYALMMDDPQSPDARRVGVLELVERPWGESPPYTDRYAQIAAEADADYLLRATAIRALNRSREPGHTDLFVKGLSDDSNWVRLESAKALNRLPDPAAAPALIAVLSKADEAKDVRIAAAEALQHYQRLDVARVLVGLLGEREFGLAWQAHHSLKRVTGQDFGYNEAEWLAYLTSPSKPLN